MNDREIMQAAIAHMKDTNPDPDESKGFFRQLWDNLRLSFSAKSATDQSVEIGDSARF